MVQTGLVMTQFQARCCGGLLCRWCCHACVLQVRGEKMEVLLLEVALARVYEVMQSGCVFRSVEVHGDGERRFELLMRE